MLLCGDGVTKNAAVSAALPGRWLTGETVEAFTLYKNLTIGFEGTKDLV
jgi:hypothetical protein